LDACCADVAEADGRGDEVPDEAAGDEPDDAFGPWCLFAAPPCFVEACLWWRGLTTW
jgi:hypothetical protein